MTAVVIGARNIKKDYRVKLGQKGLKAKLKSFVKPEYKTIHAVDDINLAIEEGEIVGYIGPNGAGKSTTIKMLTGILQPTAGDISVCGLNPSGHRIQNALNIGAVFGHKTQLWWDLPVRDSFDLLKRMYGVSDLDYEENLGLLYEYLELSAFEHQPVRQLSLGQRVRAEIAASCIHNPRVLFLDEPTIGLDIDVKLRIREFIQHINQEWGVTILLTTHDLQDIETLASRVVVINHGQIYFDGNLSNLYEKYARYSTLSCRIETNERVQLPLHLAEVCEIRQKGRQVDVLFPASVSSKMVLVELLHTHDLSEIKLKTPQIEDVVMEIYRS